LDDLRRLIAGGFPPVIEKSVMLAEHNLGWMGHSLFLTGYDDDKQEFTGQDSYVGPNEKFSYTGIVSSWRPFNYHYIIAYPLEKEAEVRALLGTNADADANLLFTQDQALQETKSLHDSKDLAFAWYNVGTNYVDQRRYIDAAHAYDKARSLIIPWRIVWYETGIYKAYYWSQRYQDVIELANFTLNGETELEESWYWRGMARMALGDRDGAISDWRQALAKHAGFAPALVALSQANAAS
jgi:tetratricopeptide (TPR) repeat protein